MVELPVIERSVHWVSGKTGRRDDRTFRVRILIQLLFAATSVLIGIRIAGFCRAALAGTTPLPTRPPGVEGYLPISGLMGLLDWRYQGTLNTIHPAATILVLIALGLALLLRKSFCSWICPVGFLSELLARFGRWSFGRNFRLWPWLDIPLRGLKYLLMAFFVGAVLSMGSAELQAFIQSPYNRVADVKMGLFFLEMSRTGVLVTGGLVLASIFLQGAWCRYLCPYGALLGVFSWFSPSRIRRDEGKCVECGMCDRVCMARLPISRKDQILSPECTGCLDCVAVCPVSNTLEIGLTKKRRIQPLTFAGAVMGIFLAGYLGAQAMGIWANQIPDSEYIERLPNVHSPLYGHPGR